MKAISKTLVWITMLVVATSVCAQTPTKTQAGASPRLLTPQNAVLVLIDQSDPLAEHRVYLASCGFFLTAGSLVASLDAQRLASDGAPQTVG